jgi:hypothetical protein
MSKLFSLALAAAFIFGPAYAQETGDAAPPAAEVVSRIAPPPEGKGQVVFFRQSSMGGMPYAFTIKDGDKPVTKLGNGRYFVYVADPGDHEFRVRGERKDALVIEVDPGETYYVEQTMVMGLFYYANLAPSTQDVFDNVKSMKPDSPAE